MVAFRRPKPAKTLSKRVFGVPTIADDPAEVQRLVRGGVEASKLKAVRDMYGLSQDELAKLLGVTARTVIRQTKAKSRLDPKASDRTARLVRVFDRAAEVLGDVGRAREWLRAPVTALGGECPRSWLDTDAGTSEVLRVLGRLEHGVFS